MKIAKCSPQHSLLDTNPCAAATPQAVPPTVPRDEPVLGFELRPMPFELSPNIWPSESCNCSVVAVSLYRLQRDLQDVKHVHECVGELLHHHVVV